MALDPLTLAASLKAADLSAITSTGNLVDPLTLSAIEARATAYASAIHLWILTATVNTAVTTGVTTTHAPATINVTGTAIAQTNPVAVVGVGVGEGAGVGTII
jgi:uncharacterized protein (UPF0371 family)